MMRSVWLIVMIVSATAAPGCYIGPPHVADATFTFDSDWRFARGDPDGAKDAPFDDSNWRRLGVPHDWSIEGSFDRDAPAGGAGAFLPTGVGWYRKHFTLPAADSAKHIFVEFDGVMANSDVYINGTPLGHRPYGYIGFQYELTDHVRFGDDQPNVLAVRVDNANQPASRWYAGAGINRHVRLIVANPVHMAYQSTIVTTPQISDNAATIRVRTTVVNQSKSPAAVHVDAFIAVDKPMGQRPPGGRSKITTIAPGASAELTVDVKHDYAPRWDADHPDCCLAGVWVYADDKVVHEQTIRFGVRDAKFDPATGFWLNGKNFKLTGVCLHGDGGAFGVAVPMGVWQRRLATLRELGVNAIRTAHNPPAPEFLDLCDRMGFLVMDENFDCWTVGKNKYDYHLFFNDWFKTDTRDMVRRDRNHPCIVLWSAGNEIHDTPHPDIAKPILRQLVEVFHANDPTRPVTQALFRPNVSHDYDNGLADLLDVVGQNYRENEILAAHEQKPSRKIVGTENGHDRRIWLALRDNKPYAGQFLWTGIDYLGESRSWPLMTAGSGLLDRTGAVKPMGRERQSWWSERPMVFACRRVAPPSSTPSDPGFAPLRRPQTQFEDWTPRDLSPHDENVEVYSNCESVELFLNGKSLGAKPRSGDASARVWKVRFEPRTLKAVASNAGKEVASHELRTAGKPSKIALSVDQQKLSPTWDDVAFVTATVIDENGTRVPTAADEITFAVTGPATIAAVDNADNASHESFQGNRRNAYQGRCIAVLKGTADAGTIKLTASSPNLAGGEVTVEASP
jgi:beta-galactosidase